MRYRDVRRVVGLIIAATFFFDCSHRQQAPQSTLAGSVSESRTIERTLREMPGAADAFVDSVGITTHLFYNDTAYVAKYAEVQRLLADLHVRHLRDGLANQDWQGYYDHLNSLARLGIHDDLTVDVGVPMALVRNYSLKLSGAIESLEGPNEYGGSDPTLLAKLRDYQKLLYTTVRSTRSTASFRVIGPSFTSYEACMRIGSLAATSDFGNMHDYFSSRNPGTTGWGSIYPPYGEYGSLAYNVGIVAHVYYPKPIISTETGWDDGTTYGAASYTVSPAVKTRYTMRILLEHWNAGISRTYLYELLDEGGQNFGLLTGNLVEKPAFSALKLMLQTLADPGPPATRTPLVFGLSAPVDVHHVLLEKRDSSYQLFLWDEVPATDPKVPMRTVKLSLPKGLRIARESVWRDEGSVDRTDFPSKESGNATLRITDRVTEIDLAPRYRSF